MLLRTTTLAAAAIALCVAPRAGAQDTLPAPMGTRVPYALQLGPLDPAQPQGHAASSTVRIPGAQWIRLHFAAASLPGNSTLTVTSVFDGEQQRLDRAGLAMWSSSTAYFNGDTLLVQIDGDAMAPGGLLSIIEVETSTAVNPRGGPGQCGICGPDDRAPSSEDWAGRLMPIGCTASIFCVDSTLVSAGHCIDPELVPVMQFRVPNSTAGCALVNPPVNDQFPVTLTQHLAGGVGADWAVLRTGVNGLSQSIYDRYGQFRPIASSLASVGQACLIFGYGADATCTRRHTQQGSSGSITARLGTSYQMDADVRNGNSGSALIVDDQIVGIVTHCQTNCPNHATRVDRADFADARSTLGTCGQPRTITVTSAVATTVPIAVSPPDLAGDGNGVTAFSRSYLIGSAVTMVAPMSSGDVSFVRWMVDGDAAPPGSTLALVVRHASVVEAVYAGTPCPCDWNVDQSLNSQDFLDYLDDFFGGTGDFNDDGATNSQDFFDFLSCFFAGCP